MGGGRSMLLLYSLIMCLTLKKRLAKGPVPEPNPGPLAPKARIMPLDQQAHMTMTMTMTIIADYYMSLPTTICHFCKILVSVR